MRRSVLVASSTITALALVAGGWFAARAFTSPAQWEARASAPAVKPVLADVTQGDLVDVRTVSAAVVPSAQTQALLTPAADAARSIVTESSLVPGTTVKAGTVLVRVNGHPVFALASTFPFYRDLGVGDSGPDVTALQRNLISLGLLSKADGEFGSGTARAVGTLFRNGNATAPTRPDPTPRQQQRADAADTSADAALATTPEHPYLPLSAAVTVPAFPATVSQLPTIGTNIDEATTISFAAPYAVLRLSVDASMADALKTGTKAQCVIGADADAPCQVKRVFTGTGKDAGLDGDQVMTWAELTLTGGTIFSDRVDERATVRVEVATLASDSLLVPASALAQQSEASGTVLKQYDDGTFHAVKVDIIAALNGTVAVTGDLRSGDLLRVDR
ncbi:peptidoglycan-binding protein [Microbacterium sp.]|uniref:peptidoglycan-binding protein n=1 Tax=Microbacterium sp. TaxID=51671 RepID=UPI003A8CB8B0